MFTFPFTLFTIATPWTPASLATTLWVDPSDESSITTNASTDSYGWVAAEMDETNTYRMFGLNYGPNGGSNVGEIDYAIYPFNNGNVLVYESGVNKGIKSTYVTGDVLMVRKNGTTVEYLKNGTVIYTSLTSATAGADMYFDCALYSNGCTLKDVKSSYGDVIFTDVVGCSVTGNDLTKTASQSWGNAGAYSTNPACTSGNFVSQIDDKSGNDYHLTKSVIESEPMTGIKTINGLNALSFDGESNILSKASLSIDCDVVEAYVIFRSSNLSLEDSVGHIFNTRPENATQGRNRISADGTELFSRLGGTLNTNASDADALTVDIEYLISNWGDTSGNILYVNGSEAASAGAYDQDANHTRLQVGGTNTAGFVRGVIGELVFITGTNLSTADRQKLEGYLAWKWGLRFQLPDDHPYRYDGSLFGYPYDLSDSGEELAAIFLTLNKGI